MDDNPDFSEMARIASKPVGLRSDAELRAEIERLLAALTCVVAAMDENHITALPRTDACPVEVEALRALISK